jgi:hypothetical protein
MLGSVVVVWLLMMPVPPLNFSRYLFNDDHSLLVSGTACARPCQAVRKDEQATTVKNNIAFEAIRAVPL